MLPPLPVVSAEREGHPLGGGALWWRVLRLSVEFSRAVAACSGRVCVLGISVMWSLWRLGFAVVRSLRRLAAIRWLGVLLVRAFVAFVRFLVG